MMPPKTSQPNPRRFNWPLVDRYALGRWYRFVGPCGEHEALVLGVRPDLVEVLTRDCEVVYLARAFLTKVWTLSDAFHA